MFTIRPFQKTDNDYAKVVSVENRVWAEYPDTITELKESDATLSPLGKWDRLLAEANGLPIGFASYRQPLGSFHPNRFWIEVSVLPEFRRKGIGTALFEQVMEELTPHNPATIHTNTREDFTETRHFLHHRGFEEVMREWESRLNPATVDLSQWTKYDALMAQAGIEIKSVRELESDPDRDRKLYELEWEVEKDVPMPKPPTKMPFEEWQKVWTRTNLLPDAWWIAVQDGHYVGETNFWGSHAQPGVLYTGLTGVVRSRRRMGIASALKIHAVRYAQTHRFREIRTWNEAHNEGMLDINARLGFVRQPAHIDYVRKLREEPALPVQ